MRIGAETNLAARLQSIAPAGGIMRSYETYAHVKDIVEAETIEPISMKAISRPVVPYLVARTSVDVAQLSTVISEKDEGLSLMLDISGMDPTWPRARLHAALAMLDAGESQIPTQGAT
jgi:adenylate cyclase